MGYIGRQPTNVPLTSSDIADSAVSTDKLAPDAVTTAKIAPATVASSDIAPATIAASNIAPATITTTQIAPGTVAASNIAPATITQDKISPAVNLGIEAVSSNPPSPSEGDVWLRKDLTSNQLKAYLTGATSFSSAPNYPITAYALIGAGTGTDTTFVGGFQMPGSSSTNTSNEYNGTSFSGAPAYPLSVYGHAMAANSPGSDQRIAGGRTYPGSSHNTTNTYDGSSFSSAPSLSVARYLHAGGGPSSAMKILGGDPAPGSNTAEDWNGSSWATGSMIPSGRHAENGMNMVGPTSDMCIAGGRDAPSSPYPGIAYKWDGSSWSTLAPRPPMLPSSHSGNNLCFGSGSSDLYTVGGENPAFNGCQKYNGSTWVSQANYPTSKSWIGGGTAGNASSAGNGILAAGSPPTNACNEYNYGLTVTDLN